MQKKIKLIKPIILISGLGFALLFIILANSVVTKQNWRHEFDQYWFNLIANHNQTLIWWARQLTILGNTMMLTLATLTLFISLSFFHHFGYAWFSLGVIEGSSLVNWLLKQLFIRPRPQIPHLIEASGYSFPSGHCAGTMALFGVLTVLTLTFVKSSKIKAALCLGFAFGPLVIGWTRIALQVHYPSDVVGGWLIGLSLVLITTSFLLPKTKAL